MASKDQYGMGGPQLATLAFLWPALMAESASEFAAAAARGLANLAVGPEPEEGSRAPEWATENRVMLELTTVRLRDFATTSEAVPTLICAPFALHGATITDFAPRHSLVAALHAAGLNRVFVTDWRSASPDMRFLTVDNYVADLNVAVDELGGRVNLVGLCQGGWMSLIYAARFSGKIARLVLAGAPVDLAAGNSRLSELARDTPLSIFRELVEIGGGRLRGRHALRFWSGDFPDRNAIHALLQSSHAPNSAAFASVESRFRDWYAATLDLPGSYYLQVVEQLFKENRLPNGHFVALGRKIDLRALRCPVFLLAAQYDDVVAPEQIFAAEHLVDPHHCTVEKAVAPCGHLGLFMGRQILTGVWRNVARWLMH